MAIRTERERAGPCCSRGIDKSPACAGSDLAIRTELNRAGPCCSRGSPDPRLCAGSDLSIRTGLKGRIYRVGGVAFIVP
ncbi:hypothetical protein QUF80_20855 [Desulfococcaceae bacterium HSG8]|nr:hypothetical protein [Desulfococcaceae bacterium HSG8]